MAEGLLALLILQVGWLLGYTPSYGYLPAFVTSTNTQRTRRGWSTKRSGRDVAVDPPVRVVGVRTSGCYLVAGDRRWATRPGRPVQVCHRLRGTRAVTIGAGNRAAWMVRGRMWPSQTGASAVGWGSRRARSQSTVRLMPSVRSVSGFQPSTRPARVGSNALA